MAEPKRRYLVPGYIGIKILAVTENRTDRG